MTQFLPSILTALAALAAVLGLVWLAARAARMTGLGQLPRPGRELVIEDRIALDPRRRLLLVRCSGRRVLVMTGGAADLVVGWIGDDHA